MNVRLKFKSVKSGGKRNPRTALTDKEQRIVDALVVDYLKRKKEHNKKDGRLAIGMVGLVGSGKSWAAHKIAEVSGGVVISSNDIRIRLRDLKLNYNHVRDMSLLVAEALLRQGRRVILDSDHGDPKKRQKLAGLARHYGTKVLYVRTTLDLDLMIGRAMFGKYNAAHSKFFTGASTAFKGTNAEHGTVILVRELLRRMPLHYNWKKNGGGTWILKRFPYVDLEIDVSNEKLAEKSIKRFLKRFI